MRIHPSQSLSSPPKRWKHADQQQSKSAVCFCTLHGTCCAARLSRWPFLMDFPTVSVGGIWHWPNSPAARPATVVSRVTFWQPGLPQGGRAEPGGTDHTPVVNEYDYWNMALRHRTSSYMFPGPSKLGRCRAVRRTTTGAQCAVVAALQHVGSTASMLGWTR